MSILPTTLHALLGCKPADQALLQHELFKDRSLESIKAFSDVVYYNYTSAGISLQFSPSQGYKPARTATRRGDLDERQLTLTSIDIYCKDYDFDRFPMTVTYLPPAASEDGDMPSRSTSTAEITKASTGKSLVQTLGEPDRKGGGESRSVGVWLEWTDLGIMVEFSGLHGQQRWDKEHGAGGTRIGVLTIFQPGKEVGQETDA